MIDNKTYYLEGVCVSNDNGNSKDKDNNKDNCKIHPEKNSWTGKSNFSLVLQKVEGDINCEKYKDIQDNDIKILLKIANQKLKKTHATYLKYKTPLKCQICNKKNISKGIYISDNNVWEDGLIHYIDKHNYEPSNKFIQYVYLNGVKSHSSVCHSRINVNGKIVKKKNDIYYVKLETNQIMIIDALMRHGGYTKKYKGKSGIFRYSEHSGLLSFRNQFLDKVIVSGNTKRVDKGDEDIFLPNDVKGSRNYEYVFHTHPPTPKPGGRASSGILYEFPSVGDVLHFIYQYNDGKTVGSIVVTPEGLYNIRKKILVEGRIDVNEDDLFKDMIRTREKVQKSAIKKYGTKFTLQTFYSKISQNTMYIENINKTLNKYEIHIDYFPRNMDDRGKWVIGDIYLPIYSKLD